MNKYGNLLERILEAPVGQIVTVLGETLNRKIRLAVIEQNTIAPNQFVRNVSITADEMPIVKAIVKFDSTVLPEFIMTELLKKKRGIGTILNVNKIKVTRNIISVNKNPNKEKASREYKLLHKEIIWFRILEEIRLDILGSNKN